jgi:hypothetical protein
MDKLKKIGVDLIVMIIILILLIISVDSYGLEATVIPVLALLAGKVFMMDVNNNK